MKHLTKYDIGAVLVVASVMTIILFALSCNSISSIGVTGSYGNDLISVGVVITFKEMPSAETIASLESANAVRIKSSPEVWAMGNYSSENKHQVKAVETSLRNGATIERIE